MNIYKALYTNTLVFIVKDFFNKLSKTKSLDSDVNSKTDEPPVLNLPNATAKQGHHKEWFSENWRKFQVLIEEKKKEKEKEKQLLSNKNNDKKVTGVKDDKDVAQVKNEDQQLTNLIDLEKSAVIKEDELDPDEDDFFTLRKYLPKKQNKFIFDLCETDTDNEEHHHIPQVNKATINLNEKDGPVLEEKNNHIEQEDYFLISLFEQIKALKLPKISAYYITSFFILFISWSILNFIPPFSCSPFLSGFIFGFISLFMAFLSLLVYIVNKYFSSEENEEIKDNSNSSFTDSDKIEEMKPLENKLYSTWMYELINPPPLISNKPSPGHSVSTSSSNIKLSNSLSNTSIDTSIGNCDMDEQEAVINPAGKSFQPKTRLVYVRLEGLLNYNFMYYKYFCLIGSNLRVSVPSKNSLSKVKKMLNKSNSTSTATYTFISQRHYNL